MINAAGSTAIMAERGSDSYTELIDKAAESLDYGYDLTFIVSKKPLEASIAANRTNKLRAVVCRTQADASKARRAKANIIIMDDEEFSKTSAASIMRGWLGSAPEPSSEEPEEEGPGRGVGITEMGSSMSGMLEAGMGMIKKPFLNSKAKAKREEPVEEDEEDIKKPKGGGIIKSLKYTFGIE